MSFNKIFPHGRARENLKHFFPKQSLEGDCPEKEDALVNPSCISMDSAGWASICWNMAMGNAKESPLSKLIAEYSWESHPVTRTLVETGPLGLTYLPESRGFDLQEEKYIDRCHLCIDLRRYMRRTYPEMFI